MTPADQDIESLDSLMLTCIDVIIASLAGVAVLVVWSCFA